ncbi:NEW3 domain-containing protein [Candidatus Hydrogenedentota bacterium]
MRKKMILTILIALLAYSTPLAAFDENVSGLDSFKLIEEAMSSTGEQLSREESLNLLDLKDAILELEKAKTNFEEKETEWADMKSLGERLIVSPQDVDKARQQYLSARTNYELAKNNLQRTALEFLQDATHVSFGLAQKRANEESETFMTLQVRNDSNKKRAELVWRWLLEYSLFMELLDKNVSPDSEGAKAAFQDLEDGLDETVTNLLRIEDLRISVESNNVHIGKPTAQPTEVIEDGKPGAEVKDVGIGAFEYRFEGLPLDKTVEMEFQLLGEQSEEYVTVVMEYQNEKESRPVYLIKVAGEDKIDIIAKKFSLEGELGSEAKFDLQLTRYAEDEADFYLGVANMPQDIKTYFEDDDRRVTMVKFYKGSQTQDIDLIANIPKDMEKERIAEPVDFLVVVAPADKAEKVQTLLEAETVTIGTLQRLGVAFEEMQLTPKGVGEIELNHITNLYLQINPGEEFDLEFEIENTGTVDLEDVRLEVEQPLGWDVIISPTVVDEIRVSEKAKVGIHVVPAESAEVGKDEIRVGAECVHEGETIKADEKTVTVQIRSKTNLIGMIVLIGLLVALVLGVAVFTVYVARR